MSCGMKEKSHLIVFDDLNVSKWIESNTDTEHTKMLNNAKGKKRINRFGMP